MEPVRAKIGLEIHVSPRTRSKLFCACPASEAEPNENVCEVCLGYPGSKPVLNKTALEHAVIIAMALSCEILPVFSFSRKTYFYPDLAKNYQITQFETPLGTGGFVGLESGETIRIRRVHLEEDPAALVHEAGIVASPFSLMDYNRSGRALVEIVTEPDLTNAAQARAFLDELAAILSYFPFFKLGEDAMKADANVSIQGGERVEIKNITGFRDVSRAIENEIIRQTEALARGERIEQHTRGFDATTGKSFLLRTKEAEDDYGYIFEPDLPMFAWSPGELEQLRKSMPPLPPAVRKQLLEAGYSPADAKAIAAHKSVSDFLNQFSPVPSVGARLVRVLVSISNYENRPIEELVDLAQSSSSSLSLLCTWLTEGRISEKTFKDALIAGLQEQKPDFGAWVQLHQLLLEQNQNALDKWIDGVLAQNASVAEQVRAGDEKALNFLIGAVMRASQSGADPRKTRDALLARLKKPGSQGVPT